MSTYYNGKLFPKKPKYDKWGKLKEYLEKLAKDAGKGTVTARTAITILNRMKVLENNEQYYEKEDKK